MHSTASGDPTEDVGPQDRIIDDVPPRRERRKSLPTPVPHNGTGSTGIPGRSSLPEGDGGDLKHKKYRRASLLDAPVNGSKPIESGSLAAAFGEDDVDFDALMTHEAQNGQDGEDGENDGEDDVDFDALMAQGQQQEQDEEEGEQESEEDDVDFDALMAQGNNAAEDDEEDDEEQSEEELDRDAVVAQDNAAQGGNAIDETAARKAAEDHGPPSGSELADETANILGGTGDFMALFGNGGKENTGHNAVGNLWDWDQDVDGNDETNADGSHNRDDHTDAHISGPGDMIGGFGQMGGGFTGMLGGVGRMRKGEDTSEKVQGGLEATAGVGNQVGGFIKTMAGFSDALHGNTDHTVQHKVVGDSTTVGADILSLGAKGVDNYRNLKKFGGGKKKWSDASKSTRTKRAVNATKRGLDMVSTTTRIGNNIGKLAEQGASAVSTAPNAVAQYALAPMSIAMGTIDLAKATGAAVSAGKSKTKLTKAMKGIERDDEGYVRDEDADQMHMMEHLHRVNSKRQMRAGLNATTASMQIAGGAMTASGMGAAPGMIVSAASGATKLGALAVRKGKQARRDHNAKQLETLRGADQTKLSKKERSQLETLDKYERMHEYKRLQKRAENNRLTKAESEQLKGLVQSFGGTDPSSFKLSKRDRVKMKFRADTTRSSKAKQDANMQAARTLLELWKKHDRDDFNSKQWKAARDGLGVDSKKWASMVRDAGGDDGKLLEAVVKRMNKRE